MPVQEWLLLVPVGSRLLLFARCRDSLMISCSGVTGIGPMVAP